MELPADLGLPRFFPYLHITIFSSLSQAYFTNKRKKSLIYKKLFCCSAYNENCLIYSMLIISFYILRYLLHITFIVLNIIFLTTTTLQNKSPACGKVSASGANFYVKIGLALFLFSYALGPALTRALPASFVVYLTKFFSNLEARSFAFSSHFEAQS